MDNQASVRSEESQPATHPGETSSTPSDSLGASSTTSFLLMIDDNESLCKSLGRVLRKRGWKLDTAGSLEEATRKLDRRDFDAVLLDLILPDASGLDAVDRVKHHRSRPDIVVLSGSDNAQVFVECMFRGVYYVLCKPADPDVIDARLCEAVARSQPVSCPPDEPFLAVSVKMRRLLKEVDRIAQDGDLSVVIMGETGTGKELIARRIHQKSPRAGKLVCVNCSAIPRELAESTLFGARKGPSPEP